MLQFCHIIIITSDKTRHLFITADNYIIDKRTYYAKSIQYFTFIIESLKLLLF